MCVGGYMEIGELRCVWHTFFVCVCVCVCVVSAVECSKVYLCVENPAVSVCVAVCHTVL